MTGTLEVRAHLDDTLLACAILGPPEARWPSAVARAGAGALGAGAFLLFALGEPALGGAALLLATALVVLGARSVPVGDFSPFEVRRAAAGLELSWPAGLEGVLETASDRISLAALRAGGRVRVVGGRCVHPAAAVPLRVLSGALRLAITLAPPPDRMPRSRARDPERRALLGFALGSIVLHASVVALALSLPSRIPIVLTGRASRQPARPALVAMPEHGRGGGPLQLWLSSGGESVAARPRSLEVRPGRGGRAGRDLYALRGPRNNPDPHLARRLAETAAAGAGVSSLLRHWRGDAEPDLANLFGDLPSITGNVIGAAYRETYGVSGLGVVGTGRGGGGTGSGIILGGSLGTLGRGGGGGGAGYSAGHGWFTGRTVSGCGSRDAEGGCIPSVITGSASQRCGGVAGRCLDKETIRRVVRQRINEVRYCYQKELQLYPNGLEGRVTIRFEIQPDGTVSTSRVAATTLGAPAIESCIEAAPRRWRFPRAPGGGLTVVSYPFYFRTAGGR